MIQFLHRAGKPLFSRSSRRYSQETESKAFSISSLKSKAGGLGSVVSSGQITDIEEVILDASFFYESTPGDRDEVIKFTGKANS